MKTKWIILLVIICFIFSVLSASAETKATTTSSSPQKTPEGRDAPIWNQGQTQKAPRLVIEKISEGVFRLGNIIINKPGRYVSMEGEINMDEGLVEYLACGAYGKLHESILKVDTDPYYLNIALLLIGLEPGSKPIKFQGAAEIPEGDPVEIWVSWKNKENKKVKHRAEDLVLNKHTEKSMKHVNWVFAGSEIIDGKFMADVEQSIAAIYHDPFAIFDHTLATGVDDTIYFVNKDVVPVKGTLVSITVKSVKDRKSD